MNSMQQFPKGFLWGSATSSHQVEGGTRNDWSEWEKQNAERLAKEAEKKFGHLSNCSDIKAQAQDPKNYISGRACDHYNRYEEDFDIAKSLGHNVHRFSIEWSRIEPEEGKWDEKEIQHYQKVIDALREQGMEPFVTLWHWTLPIWVAEQGGWENPKTIDDFARYCDKIVRSLKSVAYWITLNEPEFYTMNSYLRGKRPPQKKSFFKFLKVYKNLAKAHNSAYEIIHSNILKNVGMLPQIGVAKNNSYFDGWLAPGLNYVWNNWFLNKIKNHQD